MPKPVHVAELATRLHETDKLNLRYELEPGTVVTDDQPPDGYVLTNDTIEFSSLSERNRHVAAFAYEVIREALAVTPDLLYERAYELWRCEISHPDKASGRLMGMAAGELDILSVGSQRIRRGEDVFDVLHLIEAGLPFVEDLNIGSLIDLCEAKYERTKNDLAGGAIHSALETWFASRPALCIDLHGRLLGSLTDASATLLSNAVLALAKSDYATAFGLARIDSSDTSSVRARVGTWTLGCLLLEEAALAEQRADVAALVSNLIETADGDLRSQAVRAATNAMHVNPTFDVLLKRLATGGDQDVLSGVATALFMNAGEMIARDEIQEWLDLMTGLTPEFTGAIDNLDNAMARLLTQPANVPVVVATLTKWAARHGRRAAIDKTLAELFHNTVNKLSRMETVWSALVTDWLLSEKQEHAACLAGMLTDLPHGDPQPLRLDKDRLDSLDPAGLLFLARRMLGYVHDRAQVTSMALSMLESRDTKARIFPVLRAFLVDEVGYDYPGSTVRACTAEATSSASSSSEEATAFLGTVVNTLEQIGKSFSDLPQLNELKPPIKLRRLFALARAKQMSDSVEDAQKESIWRLITTEIPIKAGRGTFNYQNASYGPSMQLSSISHSIEMPRREVFDPVGNAIRLTNFRIAKRDEA